MAYCPTCNDRFDEGTFCPKDGTPLVEEGHQHESMLGQVVGHYRLAKLLGRGGMGEVYIGEHLHITKKVAIKLLHHDISSNPEAVTRFRQEAQSSSSIGHPNIVGMDDFGTMDDGRVYLCMEFLEGRSLSEAMQGSNRLDLNAALQVMVQVCHGLHAAHGKDIVHRDMKPENVFLAGRAGESPLVKILDFGIAKVSGTDQNQSLTKTGTVFGTPHYMSPEQALGQKLDHRADVYSVGVMLFEIVTGQVPFKAESFMGILSQHITKPPPSPSTLFPGLSVPPVVEEIILKAMAKEPDQRYGDMLEMSRAIEDAIKTLAPDTELALAPPTVQEAVAPTMASPTAQPPAASPTPVAGTPIAGQVRDSTTPGQTPIPGTVLSNRVQPPGVAAGATPVPAVGPAVTPVPVVPSPKPVVMAPAEEKSKKGLMIAVVVVTLLVLGGGGAALALFLSADDGHDALAGKDSPAGTESPAVGGTKTTASSESPPQPAAESTAGEESKDAPQPKTEPQPKPQPKDEPKARPQPQPKDEPKARPQPQPKDEPKARPQPQPKDEPKPKPEPKTQPKPKRDHYQVKLVSVPSNAAVFKGGKRIGRTPLVLKLKPGQSLRLKLAKGGRKDTMITVTAEGDKTHTVRLPRRSFGGGSSGIPGANPGIPDDDPFK